ncbi:MULTISPECIES: hypothetical protein [unclassified Microcoleus]|uniref:hypothetical protein n=1 Tax=unclassified Microcoleus TaxID=2642155 RepID=UPI002FD1EB00
MEKIDRKARAASKGLQKITVTRAVKGNVHPPKHTIFFKKAETNNRLLIALLIRSFRKFSKQKIIKKQHNKLLLTTQLKTQIDNDKL